MTRCIHATDAATCLTARRHTNSTAGPVWRPGFRAVQASPRTVRIWHDGDDEREHLDQYAEALRGKGYTVTVEPGITRRRPALRVTHP